MSELDVFQTERIGGALVVVPKYGISALAAEEFKPEVRQLLASFDDPAILHAVVDLEHVAYFGTSMLEVMHALWRRLRDRGGRLLVCNVSPVGREVLRVSRFDTLWEIHATRDEAVAALGAEPT